MFRLAAFISKRPEKNCRRFSTAWIALQSFEALFWKGFRIQVRFWHLSLEQQIPWLGKKTKVPEVFPSHVLPTGCRISHRALLFPWGLQTKQRDNLCQGTKPCHALGLCPVQTFTPQVDIEAIGRSFSFSADMRCAVGIVNEEQRGGQWETENGKMKDLHWWHELTYLHGTSGQLAKILLLLFSANSYRLCC